MRLQMFSKVKRMKLAMVLIPLLLLTTTSGDLLQNSDFELPPSNLPENSNISIVLSNENNTIPGWTFEGNVEYVTITLSKSGHAMKLGQDGRINQTFVADGDLMHYLLTFTLSRVGQTCSSANATLIVSAPDSSSEFSLQGRYGEERWESYGHQLGSWGGGESINLVFQSQVIETDSNFTCWPMVDALQLKTIRPLTQREDNLLINGGFEFGPNFPDNSSEGLLLDSQPSSINSALQEWSVMGTVKYIGSDHYFVPKGNAAIEIVSGVSSGIQTSRTLIEGSTYNLKFMLGDANDSCTGDFIVGVQAGTVTRNFSLLSNGTGSATEFSLSFEAESSTALISFQSYRTIQRRDGVFCGPVIDEVILRASGGRELYSKSVFLIVLFLLVSCLFSY